MKRFRFQLDTVLDYKQQALDALMVEHGVLQEQVRRQTLVRDAAVKRLAEYDEEYARKRAEGITVVEAMEFQVGFETLGNKIKQAEKVLRELEKKAEEKRQQVIEARKGTFSLEKLREIRKAEYTAEVQKADEVMIDDLTAARWSAEKASF